MKKIITQNNLMFDVNGAIARSHFYTHTLQWAGTVSAQLYPIAVSWNSVCTTFSNCSEQELCLHNFIQLQWAGTVSAQLYTIAVSRNCVWTTLSNCNEQKLSLDNFIKLQWTGTASGQLYPIAMSRNCVWTTLSNCKVTGTVSGQHPIARWQELCLDNFIQL